MSARPHNRPGKFLKAAQQSGAHKPFQLWSAVVFHLECLPKSSRMEAQSLYNSNDEAA
jgi:hypothetical protein